MNAIFIDPDPEMRRFWERFAAVNGIACRIAATPREARAALAGGMAESYAALLVVMETTYPREDGPAFAREIRRHHPRSFIFAHTHPRHIEGGDEFDRVFFKANGTPAAMRAVYSFASDLCEYDLLHIDMAS